MILKHRIAFKLRAYGKTKSLYQIQMHVTFNCERLVLSTGCQISDLDSWDSSSQMVIKGYVDKKGATDLSINEELRKCLDSMDMTFKYFEVNDIIPTKQQVEEKYYLKLHGNYPEKTKTSNSKNETPKLNNSLFDIFEQFTTECGEKNSWTKATFEKMNALKADLINYNGDLQFDDLNENGLTAFVQYLRQDKQLRTPRKKKGERVGYDKDDVTGLKNSTIEKKLGYLKWFLRWATNRGYNTEQAFKTFKPTLKSTQKKVIYLTKEELEQLQKLVIPATTPHLEHTRDIFLFCCFSGLRHSDIYNLKREDVKGNHIEITTVKTADSISIELNNITKSILEKYRLFSFPANKALPVVTNQAMNRDLKELCRLAGINDKIRITTYKGNQRIDEVKEKWELVGTHTGRRTFIVNALSLGIAPTIVMKWTGHADYKSMKPYIDIVDEIKSSSMTKFNDLLT